MAWAILHQIVCNQDRVDGGVYVEHRVVFRWFGLSYNYTDVHARPEASSDMSVFPTITAGWLLLANFNRRTVANAVHRD